MQINSESVLLPPPPGVRGVPGQGARIGQANAIAAAPIGPAASDAATFQAPGELDRERFPITLEGLKRAWGTSDSTYDLNGDGTVDMSDLLEFLAQLPRPDDRDPDATDGGPVASDVEIPPVDDGPANLTVEGFDGAWGTDDSSYDLNGDGTVNMADLLAFLAQHQSDSDPETDVLTTTPGVLTEEGFQAAWGTSDSTYDLNGDGTVNMVDLLAFLDQQNQSQTGGNGVPGGDSPSLLEQFHEAWGTDDPQFDLNGDGTVNMSDLLAFLAQLNGGGDDIGARQAAGDIDPEQLAQSIVSRFEAAGFVDRPPTNARQIVDGLGLDDLASRLIVEHITSRYPDGLKLDVTG